MCNSFLDWPESVLALQSWDQGIWAYLCWGLWRARNNSTFANEDTDVGDIIHNCLASFSNFSKINDSLPKQPTCIPDDLKKWRKSPPGLIKVNLDDVVKKDEGGIGVIGRAETGETVFTGAKQIQFGTEVVVAEAKAARWGLQLAASAGFEKVMVESDSLSLIQKANAGDIPNTACGDVIALAVDISQSFLCSKWVFCRRGSQQSGGLA